MSSSYYYVGHANSPEDKMTKTEELRERIAELLIIRNGWSVAITRRNPPVWEQFLKDADLFLKACKEAGLAFVVKDAELPRNMWSGDFGYGYGLGRQDMLKAGFRQTKEIELT